ncbi:MAG: hypothetical protein K6T99_09310 [Armatimonadetes bacterium]|nr:hypothetical protein [Armatimonadota bacterium]
MEFSKFQKPENILRPAPFWAINDRITPEETARQLEDMIDVGLSGGFFHSRAGLITDYLGEDWFKAMRAALDVAKKRDGYLWLYDEDLWPSGNAGGQVAGMKDEYRQAGLQAEFVPVGREALPDGNDEPKAAYVLVGRKGAKIERAEQIDFDKARTYTDYERLLFRRHYADKTPWWGGESYANLLNPEAMQQFIQLTHEVYKSHLSSEFGKRIPGIFTDEPHVRQGGNTMAWWEGLPDAYKKWYGRDFWADLPYLYFDGHECRKIRLFIHRTIHRQFQEAFSKPIYEWCEKNGLERTGHYLMEDSFEGQISCCYGGVMPFYRWHQAPGIDHLCRQVDGILLTAKQVGSAARQLGRKRVLDEIFGVTRHTNTFEDFKWIGDYDLALGVNFFCPHLTLYSIRGRRKRDYPPNWNYQQTYWKELKPLNDYFTRLAQVLSSGKAKPDVLILHPIESGTSGHRFGINPPRKYGVKDTKELLMPVDLPGEEWGPARHFDGLLKRTLDSVLNAGYDADLGDESFLEEMGAVEGDRLRVGEMTYPVVILPPAQTWRPKTFEMLKQFAANGGKVLILGKLPTELDCDDATNKWKDFASSLNVYPLPCGAKHIQEALDRITPRSYSLRGADGHPVPKLYLQHRVDGEDEIFFIVNSDRDRAHDYVLTFLTREVEEREIAIWNPLDGTRKRIRPEKVGDNLRYAFSLPPAGSILIVAGPNAAGDAPDADIPPCLSLGEVMRLPDSWQFARSEKNVLVMDRLAVSVDGGKTWWDEDMEFRVRRRLAEHFGTSDALHWQPWVAIRKGAFNGKGGPVILRYKFKSVIAHPKSAYLVMEDMDKGRVVVNGVAIDLSNMGWYWDRSFGMVEITNLVHKGINLVDFHFDYNFLSEVEAAYIVGDFGVRLVNPYEGEIVEEPAEISNGSWIVQGYPFYSGIITYRTLVHVPADGKRTFLRLIHPSGIMYKVRVNGRKAGKILGRPFELELTNLLNGGMNELEIEVVGSRQNTFGPLHERDGEDFPYCGPNAFEDENAVKPELSLFDYGLLGGAELVRVK